MLEAMRVVEQVVEQVRHGAQETREREDGQQQVPGRERALELERLVAERREQEAAAEAQREVGGADGERRVPVRRGPAHEGDAVEAQLEVRVERREPGQLLRQLPEAAAVRVVVDAVAQAVHVRAVARLAHVVDAVGPAPAHEAVAGRHGARGEGGGAAGDVRNDSWFARRRAGGCGGEERRERVKRCSGSLFVRCSTRLLSEPRVKRPAPPSLRLFHLLAFQV